MPQEISTLSDGGQFDHFLFPRFFVHFLKTDDGMRIKWSWLILAGLVLAGIEIVACWHEHVLVIGTYGYLPAGLFEDYANPLFIVMFFAIPICTLRLPMQFSSVFRLDAATPESDTTGLFRAIKFNSGYGRLEYAREYAQHEKRILRQERPLWSNLLFIGLHLVGMAFYAFGTYDICFRKYQTWAMHPASEGLATFGAQTLPNFLLFCCIIPQSAFIVAMTFISVRKLARSLAHHKVIAFSPLEHGHNIGMSQISHFCLNFSKILWYPGIFMLGFASIIGFTALIYWGIMALLVFGVFLFLWPLRLVHKALRNIRDQELERMNLQYEECLEGYLDLWRAKIAPANLAQAGSVLLQIDTVRTAYRKSYAVPSSLSICKIFLFYLLPWIIGVLGDFKSACEQVLEIATKIFQ